ncbi:MAG: hypothetical protein K2R98_03210 [Gemmataceae bacterium]|nr:hypothetical protein [Gemmataceae bacterium]
MASIPRGWMAVRCVLVAAIFGIGSRSLADELEIGLGVERGTIVKVQATYANDKPAIGVKVALVDAKKATVGSGKINADGEWSWPAPGPGVYEVVFDPGTGDKDVIRHSIEVKGAVLPSPDPEVERVKCPICPVTPPRSTARADAKCPFADGIACFLGLASIGFYGIGFWWLRLR